jgi:hypothetical protein
VEETRLKKFSLNRREISLKLAAVVLAAMIIISSATMIRIMIRTTPESNTRSTLTDHSFQSRTCKATAVLAQEGIWITADSSMEGTPSEAHVTVSDTSGITIVADFHGFWLDNITIDSTSYYDLEMPGASSIQAYGIPVLPCLFEFVQIPYDVDIDVNVLSSTSANVSEYITEYEIKPGSFPEFPIMIGEGDKNGSSVVQPDLFFDPVYSNSTIFPGIITSTEGKLNSTSMIMRGHRLLGLTFYPIQYSNVTKELILYSQLIIKLKYSFPAQIETVPCHLRSETFCRIMKKCVLNCMDYELALFDPGVGLDMHWIPPRLFFEGAEYLIITNNTFEKQARRLADWKERKGLPSAVHVIPDYVVDVRQHVKDYLRFVYYFWFPAPTYVLLLGDVEHIPANYDMEHLAGYFESGKNKIASDFGYFNIEGDRFLPDMIYSRISVDTELQAEIIVNKTLNYERSPTANTAFYNNFLSAGYFEDRDPRDAIEDEKYPLIYTLERIRHYLNSTLGYTAHINYSAAMNVDSPGSNPGMVPEEFREELLGSTDVMASIGQHGYFPNFEWLWGYDWFNDYDYEYDIKDYFNDIERGNIIPNFNEGRFIVLYMGHGGSRNMYNTRNMLAGFTPAPGVTVTDYRDLVEGWQHPCLNTSFLADLTNGDMTPLVINIACNTGWFDGETDQEVLDRDNSEVPDYQNAFGEYSSECFAENITRLEGGGAIAVIASSRHAYIPISKHLLNGLIQAFWPGFLGSENQPIYEMGGALFFAKIHAVSEYGPDDFEEMEDYEIAELIHPREMMVQEYHLFGDPETQLWTDVPTGLIVSYPNKIGIGEQEFVVTVIANTTLPTNYSVAVPNAKVCLQKGEDVYQVGYTDSNGQVVFKVHPGYPGMMNVTVTAHNYIPHIGEMECICSGASLTLTPEGGTPESYVSFGVNGFFDNEDVEISYEYYYLTTLTGGSSGSEVIPNIRYGYGNIIAIGVDSNLVAVAVYQTYYRNPRPDLYIYSQWDESTWDRPGVSGDDIGWSNPDISIYDGADEVLPGESLSPTTSYVVHVQVHNTDDADAYVTKVTLRYAPIGGGVTWDYVGEESIYKIVAGLSAEVSISWRPRTEGEFCLKAIVDNSQDMNLDNNVGVLAAHVTEYSSPAISNFMIGNPTDTDDYVLVCVKQKGNYSDVWNATISGYSSQVINSTHNETISIHIDPGPNPEENEWRLFVVIIYVNFRLVGGFSFNATKLLPTTTQPPPPFDPFLLALLGGIGMAAIVVVIAYFRKKSGR